jgi:hypothetical protein
MNRSAERKETSTLEIIPRVKWNRSNLPESRIQNPNIMKKVYR